MQGENECLSGTLTAASTQLSTLVDEPVPASMGCHSSVGTRFHDILRAVPGWGFLGRPTQDSNPDNTLHGSNDPSVTLSV
jgi:hypothetical protein